MVLAVFQQRRTIALSDIADVDADAMDIADWLRKSEDMIYTQPLYGTFFGVWRCHNSIFQFTSGTPTEDFDGWE